MVAALAVLAIFLQSAGLTPEAREWFVKGEELIGTEREYTEEQAACFEKALELAPGFAPAHYNLALIYLRMERFDDVLRHAGRLIELLPDDARGYQLRARVGLLQEADSGPIEADLKRVVELTPEDSRAWADLARLYYESDRYEEALAAATEAQERGPADVDTLLTIALSRHGLGQLAAAEEGYRKVLALAPEDFTSHFNLGTICRQLERPAEAQRHFLEAERARPDDARVAQELGELYLDLGKLEEARTRLLRADPDSPVNLSNLGIVARRQGDLAGAEGYFRAALERDPDNAHLWGHLADVQSERGRRAEALQSYQQALEHDPTDVDSLMNLGSILANLDEPEEARKALRRALELQPDSGDAAFRLGIVLERLERPDEAFESYFKALQLGHDEARLHFRLAVLYSGRNQPEPALAHLEEAFRRDAERLVPIVVEQLKAVHSELDAIRYKPAFQRLMERYSGG